MNDATPWIDPELIAAGQLLQRRGLVAPDRTQVGLAEVRAATDRIGVFLGEGSVPLERERDMMLPGPHGQVPCRLYLPDGAERPPLIIYAHGGGFAQGSLPSWDAMLPQKFSAATTWIVLPAPEAESAPALDEVEQALVVNAATAASPPRANRYSRPTAGRDGRALIT